MSALENRPTPLPAIELSEMLQKIEANWPILPSGIWSSSSTQQLSRHLHELSRRAKQAQDEALHNLCLAIDEAVTRVIDDNSPPDDRQMDELHRRLIELRAMAGHSLLSEPIDETEPLSENALPPLDLVYLPNPEEEIEACADALEAKRIRYRILSEPEELQEILAGPAMKVLLVDAAYLGSQDLEPVLQLIKIGKHTAPVLLVICDRSTIEMRLNALRAGATHLFSKPIAVEPMVEKLQKYIHPPPKPRHRILIVEDDESQASFAAKLLRKGDMDSLAISEPLGVIDAVASFQPDLILMDLHMPGADGIELTRLIRDHHESCGIPIVFLSGEEDPDKKLLTLLAGADDFLSKPVRPQLLMATINTRIERARQIAELTLDQAAERSRLCSRRELLSRLDLVLAGGDESPAFRALLVICLGEAPSVHEYEPGELEPDPDRSVVDELLTLLQPEDTLAALSSQRLALLYQRNDEIEVEILAERIYKTLSDKMAARDMGPIGIGMALLDGAPRNAYEQLGHAEISAESALRHGRRGYELYGDTSAAPAEELDARSARCKSMLEFLKQGSVAFRKLRYASRDANAIESVELIPMPFPSSSDGEPYQAAESCELALEFDLFVCRRALHELGELFMQGRLGRLIFRQSVAVLNEPGYLEFIRGEMRRLQIVGTGLMVEFDLSALAGDLIKARNLIAELADLGIGATLGNFSCNETSYKVLAYLKADAVRPKPSLLTIKEKKIRHIALQLHSLHTEIILPRVARRDQIASEWSESADYIQEEFGD